MSYGEWLIDLVKAAMRGSMAQFSIFMTHPRIEPQKCLCQKRILRAEIYPGDFQHKNPS
jgi:hypothetical protein